MKNVVIFITVILVFYLDVYSQQNKLFMIGGYGEIHYSQNISQETAAKLDIPRFVLTGDYSFSAKTRLFSEIEFEHVSKVYVEQLWVQHQLHNNMHIRAGLLLVPVGIINEYHEPNTFFGVNRPIIDNYVVPSTWREIGAGVAGNFPSVSLKYQAYIINGFNGYDDKARLGAQYPIRNARQKGAESYMSSPNFVVSTEYYGLPQLKIGAAYYFGKSQSELFGKVDDATLDSSRVGMKILSFNVQFSKSALELRLQAYGMAFSNTLAYNQYAQFEEGFNLAKKVYGFYTEAAYNVLHSFRSIEGALYFFARYEQFNNQYQMENNIKANLACKMRNITAGISWKPNPKIAFKSDFQSIKSESLNEWENSILLGVGFSF